MIIYIVRHGQTAENLQMRFYKDICLALLPTKVRSKYEMQLNILQKKTFSSSALSQAT